MELPFDLKQCVNCGIFKSREDFTNQKCRKDGKNPYCKTCTRSKEKERYYRNIDKSRAFKKEQSIKFKMVNKERHRECYLKNREKRKKQIADYRAKDPQK